MNMNVCSTYELLSVLVGKRKAVPLSKLPLSVLFEIRTQRQIVAEDTSHYTANPIISAAKELVMRALKETLIADSFVLNSPSVVKSYLRLLLGGRPQEVFVVIFLDAQHRIIAVEELFYGSLTQTSVYPREIARRALTRNCAAVLLAHNHPSGVTEPSQTDRQLTSALQQALALIDVRVLDHLIVGEQEALSFAERGWI